MTAAGGGDASDGAHLVDDFGLHIGRAMGWPPMAGRAAGVLMLSEKPLTLAELQEALGASKGSASEMTRLLMVNGVVERYKEPGSRQFVVPLARRRLVGLPAPPAPADHAAAGAVSQRPGRRDASPWRATRTPS